MEKRSTKSVPEILIRLALVLVISSYTTTETVVMAVAAEQFQVEISPEEIPSTPTLAEGLLVEVLRDEEVPAAQGKRILIYHTHTFEAYEQDPASPYAAIETWRTKDTNHNVVAVGKALSAVLTAMGHHVTHDTTAFEPPTMEDAYSRSLTMLEKRAQQGEVYDLYIDLHRDAVASATTIERTVMIGGEHVARFMVLVGKGTTGGYAEKPNWEANHALAVRISQALTQQCQGLARDVKVKTGRFNQHIADSCVLIECGTNWNTLDEVLAGVPYLAQAIDQALQPT